MIIKQIYTYNNYRNFNYLIGCSKTREAIAVDPLAYNLCLDEAKKNELNIIAVINTHEHLDHTGGNDKIIKKNKPYMTDIEVEVDTIEQFLECQRLDVRYILLDNMSPQYISECIKNNKNGAVLEASGGINLSTVSDIAQTGVDFISVGRLTHSSPSLDLSLHIL